MTDPQASFKPVGGVAGAGHQTAGPTDGQDVGDYGDNVATTSGTPGELGTASGASGGFGKKDAAGKPGKPAKGGKPSRFPALARLRKRWLGRLDAVPLSTKLVACTLVLLMVGTFGISLTIRQLVSSYLVQKTDTQLRDQAQLVYSNVDLLSSKNENENVGPNEYFMQLRDTDNNIVSTPLVPVLRDSILSEPVLPPNGSMGDVKFDKPFTASAKVRALSPAVKADKRTMQVAQAPWRVLALEGRERGPDGTSVVKMTVYIGVSMADQIDIINTLTQYSIFVSIIIVLLGAVVATLIIQRTLLPLKRIEKTAAKIAAGDLSQRVPTAPENTEVGSLAASLNAMLARIESSFREQQETTEKMKQFVSDASHELRTPLATIHGYSELYHMQREFPGALERADESIDHIEASSQRMTVLVEDLLSLARLDEGRGIDITQQVNLTQQLKDAVDDLHALDSERGIRRGRLELNAKDGSNPAYLVFKEGEFPEVTLTGDGSRLRQVITNIVGNIHRYTPSDSPVEVGLAIMPASISPESLQRMPSDAQSLRYFLEAVEVGQSMQMGMNYAVFSFIDHGPGVPADRQSQIFERFYTADPSRARQKGGTGLGMSIAQSVVRAHHGFIDATTTRLGGGLTLTVILPIAPVEPQVPNHAMAAGTPDKPNNRKSGRQGKQSRQGMWPHRDKNKTKAADGGQQGNIASNGV
ncbi:HAMP domain-containing sensor histidine kinase [Bifidobacterium sp. ESL0775]|uniref:sensor histidine kinase n=1 Tax=Bifidobacterium sp. ESL0775 TaxID=2983230 RepID=UPI0023F9798E|nr:HAMP domain-containing sensor histidine kinase [Bifidobacterium sp. ESL0775]WEV69986.1 HAMP domain-containing sensor histidine kinase [Bifidobacterium sp. ESL0775]